MDYYIIIFFFILFIIIILNYNKNEFVLNKIKFNNQIHILILLFVLLFSLLCLMYQRKKEGMEIEIINNNEMLTVLHGDTEGAGFFSGCSVRLCEIINYYNKHKKLPKNVDSTQLFHKYKYDKTKDITFDLFKHYDDRDFNVKNNKMIDIDYMCYQFENYKSVDYESITPFINKYFYPSDKIMNIYNDLINRYDIQVDKCIGLYYRGTDKYKETPIDSFDSYYKKLKELTDSNENLQILLQTDSSPFLDYMKEKFKNNKNIIIMKENDTSYTNKGIHFEKSGNQNYIDIQNLLATFLIISKCKYILCSSGNGSIWIMFYRKNAKKVFQNLNKVWI